jgi:uncharacterized protein (DUF2267 family)
MNDLHGGYSMTGLDTFDTTVQKTNLWLKEIMEEEGWEDRHRAYLALRSVLHTLRDRLVAEEATHLGAQLPMLVRGLYYEGWTLSGKPVKERTKEEFLAHIRDAFQNDPDVDSEEVLRGVLTMLSKRISEGEIEDIRGSLPKEILELWPQSQ